MLQHELSFQQQQIFLFIRIASQLLTNLLNFNFSNRFQVLGVTVFWWLIILRTWQCRTSFSDCPLQLIWVPSHVGDNMENADITDDFAARHRTTVRSIILNKVADKAAKTAASNAAAIHPQMWTATRNAVYQRQLFLSRWNFHIGFNPSAPATAEIEPATGLDPLAAMKKRFGRWDWTQNSAAFSWSSTAKIDCTQGWFKKLRPDDVDTFFRFHAQFTLES